MLNLLVPDKGSAALANTLELEKAGVGWISALPGNQALRELRPRQQLTELSCQEPGVSATAQTMLVQGKEYLCVVKYSAPFASEQLRSLTTSVSKVMQSLRRLTRELEGPSPALTEKGMRSKIARWLPPQHMRDLIHCQLEKLDGRRHRIQSFLIEANTLPAMDEPTFRIDRRKSKSRQTSLLIDSTSRSGRPRPVCNLGQIAAC